MSAHVDNLRAMIICHFQTRSNHARKIYVGSPRSCSQQSDYLWPFESYRYKSRTHEPANGRAFGDVSAVRKRRRVHATIQSVHIARICSKVNVLVWLVAAFQFSAPRRGVFLRALRLTGTADLSSLLSEVVATRPMIFSTPVS